MSDKLLVRLFCSEHGSKGDRRRRSQKPIAQVFVGESGRYVLDDRVVIPPTIGLKGDPRFNLGRQKAGSWSRELPLDRDLGEAWRPVAFCPVCGETPLVGDLLELLRARATEAALIGRVLDVRVHRLS